MLLYSLLASLVTAAVILEGFFRKADFFSPVRLYLFFHSATIGIAFLGFHPAMEPFKPFTTLVYLGSGLAFVLGAVLPRLAVGRAVQGVPDFTRYNWRLHWTMAFVLFALFLSGMWVAQNGSGGFPLLAEKKQRAIYAFNHVGIYANLFYNMGAVVAAFFFVATLRPQRRPLILRAGLWFAVLSAMIFLLAMNRSGLLLAVFFSLAVTHYGVRRLSLGHMFAFIVLFMALFVPFSYSRLSTEQKDMLQRVDLLKVSGYLLKIPYVYMANNYWNLDYALNPENYQVRHPTTYGYTTFSGILELAYIPGGGVLGKELREAGDFEDMFHKQSIKVRGLNTVTYQWGLYKDFGLAGVLLVPFVVGLLIGIFYRRMREQPDVFRVAVYAYLCFFIAFNWFTAMWELMNFATGFIFVVAACWLCRKLAGPVGGSALEPT